MNKNTLSALAAMSLLLVVGAVGSGCRATTKAHGQRAVAATFEGFSLRADLPEATRVPAVMAAAEETFRARGYAVKDVVTTADSGSLTAVPPRTKDYPRMLFSVTTVQGAARVTMTHQPFPDEEVCRATLDAMLKRLGL